MSFALETQNIQKIYKTGSLEVVAVGDVSIQIQPGEFVALVGPSGSGKTTLLAMLAGLLSPSQGRVSIDGQAMSELNERQRTRFRREKIGFTFQSNNLVPYLTAYENVELMLRMNGVEARERKKRATELLVRLGLEDRLRNLPSQLSGGQKQRVAIARSLVHSPSVVLADEPTASLDTELAYQVVETFASLIHEQNRAGIMVTHDLRMVKFVDKLIGMVDGRVETMTTDRDEILAIAGASKTPIQEAPPRPVQKRKPVHTNGFALAAGD